MGDSLDERNSSSDAPVQATTCNSQAQHSPEETAKHGVETMTRDGENDLATLSKDKKPNGSDITITTETPEGKQVQVQVQDNETETENGPGERQIVVEDEGEQEDRPPLPPRPSLPASGESSLTPFSPSSRPALQSRPTTAVASVEVHTRSFSDGLRGFFYIPGYRAISESLSISGLSTGQSTPAVRKASVSESLIDDTSSLLSHAPHSNMDGDLAGLLGDDGMNAKSPAWKLLNTQAEGGNPFESIDEDDTSLANFEHEFDEIDAVDSKGENEEQLLVQFKAKYKHYMILSSAGKPIYSRHGDQNLINGYIGVIQTIISFYEEENDHLLGFVAGGTRFAIKIDGPLYFVAISKLGESDAQLRAQLDALYKQILSTLTLPTLTQLFSNRPNTDLRRPLEGTETLLSSLADTFTKGSPSALLSALECLKVRKSHRYTINNTLLKTRTKSLLYGLIVAGGRLVSVVRPKRHSLHPSDLQLIFNMLFEAGGIKAGGGENWIPICLPAFNNKGYLYMYVSFIDANHHDDESSDKDSTTTNDEDGRDDEIAVILISTDKESFFELKDMRDELVKQLSKNGSMEIIKAAVSQGRPSTTDIVPGTPLKHFLYKSRANVQFTMPSFSPNFVSIIKRRRLMSLYHELHASTHVKYSPVKVLHNVSRDSSALAWITADFEFYCVAGPKASRAALTEGADKVIKWMKREEERVFIIGGAVF